MGQNSIDDQTIFNPNNDNLLINMDETSNLPESSPARWTALTRHQRRVLGVLIEKSKTTPDVYPMTVNGIKVGCNQKSNRSPQMELSEEVVEDILIQLRKLGCVVEVHAGGRVPKYKHLAYEWLDVSKAELGVMTELLLRGQQTLGELRARSARMEKEIESLEDLVPILAKLKEKNLLLELSPAGRGQVVTHNLYQPNELESVERQVKQNHISDRKADGGETDRSDESDQLENTKVPSFAATQPSDNSTILELERRVAELEGITTELQAELAKLQEIVESILR